MALSKIMGTSYACLGGVRNLENVGKRMGADLLLNFGELRYDEVFRTPLLRARVNKRGTLAALSDRVGNAPSAAGPPSCRSSNGHQRCARRRRSATTAGSYPRKPSLAAPARSPRSARRRN